MGRLAIFGNKSFIVFDEKYAPLILGYIQMQTIHAL